MKNKTKEIHNSIMKIGAAILALAVAAGASTPAITSFTQAQPVTKTKKKAKAKKKTKTKKTKSKKKKSYKAKAGTISLSPITLTKGKSKTVSVKTKSNVKWTSSNAKVATVKSISKSKVKVYAKKEGSTKVSGKAGSAKWSFTVKVKGKPTPTPTPDNDFYFKAEKVPNTIKFYWPGVAANDDDKSSFQSLGYGVTPVDVEGSSHPVIEAIVDDNSKVKCFSSDPSILKVVNPDLSTYVKSYIHFGLIPYKAGTVTLTMTYPGGSYKKKVTVKPSAVYEKIKNFIPAVKNSGLDDAHKAFVLAAWQGKNMKYGYSKSSGLYGSLIEGQGVCTDYAVSYRWLASLVGIETRRLTTVSHEWNQVKLNNNWYNLDSSGYDNDEDGYPYVSLKGIIGSDSSAGYHSNSQKRNQKDYKANSKDFDNYDWEPFTETDQFKQLISL